MSLAGRSQALLLRLVDPKPSPTPQTGTEGTGPRYPPGEGTHWRQHDIVQNVERPSSGRLFSIGRGHLGAPPRSSPQQRLPAALQAHHAHWEATEALPKTLYRKSNYGIHASDIGNQR